MGKIGGTKCRRMKYNFGVSALLQSICYTPHSFRGTKNWQTIENSPNFTPSNIFSYTVSVVYKDFKHVCDCMSIICSIVDGCYSNNTAISTWLIVCSLLASGIITPWFLAPCKVKISNTDRQTDRQTDHIGLDSLPVS